MYTALNVGTTVPRVYDNGVITVYNNKIQHIRIGMYCSLYQSPNDTCFDPNKYQIIDTDRYLIIADKSYSKHQNTIENIFYKWFRP